MNEKIELGFLSADEYVSRRSPALRNDPNAKLSEKIEVNYYISNLDKNYSDEIRDNSNLDKQPLSEEVRLIVTIIAAREGYQIRKALDNYVNQDIDPNLYEIVILDNHPENLERDNTLDEINKFKSDNPDINVVYAYKVWKKGEGRYAIARKYAFDIALTRIHERNKYGSNDTILIANDADTESLDENYLSEILREFDTNQVVEALVTPSVVPFSSIIKPNVYAALSLWDALDDVVAQGEPRNLISRSCAYRTSIYTAIGGYNGRVKMAGDLESGWMIADSRNWNADTVIQLKTTKHVQDPRRIIMAIASRTPVNEMYYDYSTKALEIQNADNNELLSLIPNDLDWELFEEDADSFWQGQYTGMYKWRGKKRFESDFATAMKQIGVKYSVSEKRIRLENLDDLLSNYAKDFGEEVHITHSTPREMDPERDAKMKAYFFSIADGMIEARKKLADKIASQIEDILLKKGDPNDLIKEYERLSGQEYKKS